MSKEPLEQGKTEGRHEPFWKPWGAAGFLGRVLAFLVMLFVLLLLLSLFRNQRSDNSEEARADIPDPIVNPETPDPVRVPVDTTANFPHDIQNPGPHLPSPGENDLPPFGDDDIVSDDGRQIVGDRLNVILNSPTADDETFRQWAAAFKQHYPGSQYKIVYYDRLTMLLQIQVPREERNQIMEQLPKQITDISFLVFPEGLMGDAASRYNDPVFRSPDCSWYFEPIQAYDAWEITKGKSDVVVAIVDSYFDLQHDDLNSDRIVKPYCVPRRSGNVAPAEGADETSFMHGSMVASQALGNIDNGRGTAGIAPECSFMPVSLGHQVTSMTILQGLLYAIYQGAHVINLSIGSMYTPEVNRLSIEEQIELSRRVALAEQTVWDYVTSLATQRNVTIVWAAGNENVFSALDACKRGPATIKVSAVNKRLRKADFSNFGNFPRYGVEESTISAPGVDIMGAMPYNTYNIGPGTSFAAPLVTGAVALMKSLDITLTTDEIISILQETGKPVEGSTTIGKLIQIKDALLRVKDNFADFNDIMADHNKFVGLWMSTELNPIFIDGTPSGQTCRNYYEVQSTSQGRSIAYATDTQSDYTTTFTIEWQSRSIVLKEADYLTNPQEDSYHFTPSTIVCVPDSAGLLKCKARTESGHQESYYLRKVNQRMEQPSNGRANQRQR